MRILIAIAALLAYNVAISQDDPRKAGVPNEVVEAFNSEHEDATNVEWEVDGDMYEVSYEIDEVDHKVVMDQSGEVVKEFEEIISSELPSDVLSTLETKYQDREIEKAEKIKENGEEYYQITLKGTLFDKKVMLSEDGSEMQHQN